MDFAFFVVNFGYSKADYQSLTATEKAFILKAYEDKIVAETSLLNNAVANAIANTLRKKGKKPIKLWQKRPSTIIDEKDILKHCIRDIKLYEQNNGKGWVYKIYKANGMKLERRAKENG